MSVTESLLKRDIHPVILIGTRATGKSVLLASLISLFRRSAESGALMTMGDPLLSDETDIGRRTNAKAKRFFNNTVLRFIEGTPPEQTTDTEPYYIPVTLSPVNRGPNANFGILEVSGEHYMLDRNSDTLVKDMREEIANVYAEYPGPVSIIIVAPYIEGDGYLDGANEDIDGYEQRRIKEIDTSIGYALTDYIAKRQSKSDVDRILILLTKWDVHTGGIAGDDFLRAPNTIVQKLLAERYIQTLSLCSTLNQRNPGQVTYDVYSAGPMVGSQILPLDPGSQARVNSHAKRVWRWLYSNVHPGLDLHIGNNVDSPPKLRGLFGKIFLGS
jgi:hypothetical protein